MKKSIFFAYEGGHADNRDAITHGITEYNKYQSSYQANTWEELRIGGSILNRTILKAIDECEIFSCDLTYLNHNVLFELGYAIGKRKKLMILLNPTVTDAKEKYNASAILKNIGYDEFQNGRDVLKILQQRKHTKPYPIDSLLNVPIKEGDTHDLLFLSSPLENQAALDLGEYIQNLPLRIIQNNSAEVTYQTLVWYVTNIVKCKNILIHLLGEDRNQHFSFNAEYSLFAGLGSGLGKTVMLLAPEPFEAPIDYTDILIEYVNTNDCVDKTKSWIENCLPIQEVAKDQEQELLLEDRQLNLLKLCLGAGIAEEEQDDLLKYFIEIESYQQAIQRKNCIVTGRKGAGKTAMFIRLKEYFSNETSNSINIILKPEHDELLDNVERTQLYNKDKSKRALLYSVWRFVFFSRIFSELYHRVSNQQLSTINPGSIEYQILILRDQNKDILNMGHFAAMSRMYQEWDESGLEKPQALEGIYNNLLGPITKIVQDYFQEHKYTNINVLADNLDKTWDASAGLELQSDMILSLLEFNDKIPRELNCPEAKSHTILILRTDIYEYILGRAREPDKLEAKRIEIDWNLFPNRLREILESRFRFVLNLKDEESVKTVWTDYFQIANRKDPFKQIQNAVVARPRDIIYFVSKLFESAVNNNRSRAQEEDFKYATNAYSRFLHHNMLSETRAQFPEAERIFEKVQDNYRNGLLPYNDFLQILHSVEYSDDKISEFLDFLFKKDYLIAYPYRSSRIINNLVKLSEILKERRFLVFRRHKVYVQIQPNRQRLNIFRQLE